MSVEVDSVRRRARGLENTIETALVSFSNLASSSAAASASAADPALADRLERELSANLAQVSA
jgi:hypothetical protein